MSGWEVRQVDFKTKQRKKKKILNRKQKYVRRKKIII